MRMIAKHRYRPFWRALFAFLLFLALLPPLGVQGAQVSVKIDIGGSLESALQAAFAKGDEIPYGDVERLVVTGNGTLTEADGLYIREALPNLSTLNLRGFTGKSATGAFRGCTNLKTVLLPERFVISREMFYGCSSLEEVVWPVRYQLTKDCFAYCALDFSDGYPNLLNDENILTYAANQRPKVYFTMPDGNYSSIRAGDPFGTPYELQTRSGISYPSLVARRPNWLLTRENELAVTAVITRDGERLESLDTDETGRYVITYSLPYATYADTRSQTYTLDIQPRQGDLSTLIRQAEAKAEKGYTAESWRALQSALEGASAAAKGGVGVRQADLDSARQKLDAALSHLQVELQGAPSAIYVGDHFSLTPGKGSGQNPDYWTWDESFFEVSFRDEITFTALKAGETEIAYESPGGDTGLLQLTILNEGEQAAAPKQAPSPQEATGNSATSQGGLWLFTAILYLAIALLLLGAWALQKRQAKADRAGPNPPQNNDE